MNQHQTYYDAVAYLESFTNLPLKGNYVGFYLARMRSFLSLLGNPEHDLKFIHITGTAGKGSVTNLIHEMIHADGKTVGSFTSPYVTTSIEKIRVNDLYIAPREFSDIVEYLKPYIDRAYQYGPHGHPSYFEVFLAIALIYFKRKKCQWVILEVGLGGRNDATNVIRNTKISAITGIDYDHVDIIGPTLKDIAHEKAGIIKNGSVFFTGEKRPQLLRMFKNVCRAKGAVFNQLPYGSDYAQNNRMMAEAICRSLDISEEAISSGVDRSKLQCRFETMQKAPLVIIDGAHNRVKMQSTVANLRPLTYSKLHLVLSICEGKDYRQMLGEIVPFADTIVFTRFRKKERKCAQPRILMAISKPLLKNGTKMYIHLDSGQALQKVLSMAQKDDLVLITGSFFLAGELRKYWVSEEKILEQRRIY